MFPILDWLGVNYVISDRVVSKAKGRHSYSPLETEPLAEPYHPERLVSEFRKQDKLGSD